MMGWVSASDYDGSQPDPLADSTAQIIQHMNADHKDALVLLARKFAHIESTEAMMTEVDRLGFHVRLKTAEGMRGARIAFLQEVSNVGGLRLSRNRHSSQHRRRRDSRSCDDWSSTSMEGKIGKIHLRQNKD